MTWLQATFEVDSLVVEKMADWLLECGALSCAIEDAFAGTLHEEPLFAEPGVVEDKRWRHTRVIALFPDDSGVESLIAAAANHCHRPAPPVTLVAVEEQDWVRAAHEQFDAIRISDRLWIVPSWKTAPTLTAINLKLDPGLAFGTGSHPSTRLCLQWLDAHLSKEATVLDYGCGSGILAIAALKLGAKSAVGVDIDPYAVQTSRENALQNDVEASFSLADDFVLRPFCLVLANILANPLRLLAELLASCVKPGGKIMLSGLLTEQSEELSALYGRWFEMEAPAFDEGWARLIGTRRRAPRNDC